MNAVQAQVRTKPRDRCAEILELIDRCLAEVEADPAVRATRRTTPAPSRAA